MKFINITDFREDFVDFFHSEEDFFNTLENINYTLKTLPNNLRDKYIHKIKQSALLNISPLEYIKYIKYIKEKITNISSLNANNFKLEDKGNTYDLEFLGLPKQLNYSFLKDKNFEFNKLDTHTQEFIQNNFIDIEKKEIKASTIDTKYLFSDKYLLNFITHNTSYFETKKTKLTDQHIFENNKDKIIYETFTNYKKSFGDNPIHFNQLLKYQKAKETGLINEIILKFDGTLTKEFLEFINPINLKDNTLISDINILYEMVLPSGKTFTFILKSGLSSKEYIEKFTTLLNDETYTGQDLELINRIFDAQLTGQLNNVLFNFEITEDKHSIDKTFVECKNIFNEKYNDLYSNLIKIGLNNSRDKRIFFEDFSDDQLHLFIDSYQQMINSSNSSLSQKEIYSLSSSEYKFVITKMKFFIEHIKNNSPKTEEILNDLFTLDLEHIMLDSIQSYKADIDPNRKGRYYNRFTSTNEKRFLDLEDLKTSIQEDKVETEFNLVVFDGNKIIKENNINTERFSQIKNKILKNSFYEIKEIFFNKDNVRSIQEIKEILASKFEVNKIKDMDIVKFINIFIEIENEINEYNLIFKTQMNLVNNKASNLNREEVILNKQNFINSKITLMNEKFKDKFSDIFENISHFKEIEILNQKKYIYTISVNEKGEEEIFAYLEGFDPSVFGRPAHSELAEGRPVITAGELIVEKENHKFVSLNEFEQYTPNEVYSITEMNNGSGHYRPNAKSLLKGEEIMKLNGIYPKNIKNSLDRRWTIHYPSFIGHKELHNTEQRINIKSKEKNRFKYL